MHDREKVISQLETDYRDAEHRGWILVPVSRRTVKDALELLKEQEAVEPEKFMDGQVERYKCGKCGKHLLYASFAKDNYCSKCGQAVKWE